LCSEGLETQRKHDTPEENVVILWRRRLEQVPISELFEKQGLEPTVFYRWQKEFFLNGAAAVRPKARPNHSGEPERIAYLDKKIQTEVRPRIISNNGPQFIAKDFKEFIGISGVTCVGSATSRRGTCSPGVSRRATPTGIGSWRRRGNYGRFVGSRRREKSKTLVSGRFRVTDEADYFRMADPEVL
jgi:hypothetical protein